MCVYRLTKNGVTTYKLLRRYSAQRNHLARSIAFFANARDKLPMRSSTNRVKPRDSHPRERAGTAAASAILGLSIRTVQDRAHKGQIPGAAQVFDGGDWTFDVVKLRAHVREKEQAVCRLGAEHRRRIARTSTNVAQYGGAAFGSPAKKSDGAYEQAMRMLLAGASSKGAAKC